VLYKAFGPDKDNNGTLTPELQAQLDPLTLVEVIEQIKATGGYVPSGGSSAYRGVSWDKSNRVWRVAFSLGGRRGETQYLRKSFPSELEAAHQHDAWCKQYDRCVQPWLRISPSHSVLCVFASPVGMDSVQVR